MSEELVSSVQEMLKQETWTRAAISNYTKNNLQELSTILDQARSQDCEDQIKEICDELLSHNKDSIAALYLSGMIALRKGSLDNSALITIVDTFEKNHKDTLIEYMCNSILAEDPQNKFALRKLADFYKANNDDRLWDTYATIVQQDLEEADIARILAERAESQGNQERAISYYKKALQRFTSAKNASAIKEVWSKLLSLIPEQTSYFMTTQRKIAKSIGDIKSAELLRDLYQYNKNTATQNNTKIDTAISILKTMLEIDNKDSWARKEIVECFKIKYADNSRLEDHIRDSNLNQSFRNVFEAISDFEKHIAFDSGSYVFHRSWGVGIIRKVQGDKLTINFGKKGGIHEMSLKMAVDALTPLAKDHIWVLKKTMKPEELAKKIKSEPAWALEKIIRSFEGGCDDKRIKAELVDTPADEAKHIRGVKRILTPGEWTSWHAKAQNELAKNPKFDVSPTNRDVHIVRDTDATPEERLANEFKAEKDFFERLDILMRYVDDDSTDKSDEPFSDMVAYFASYVKAFSSVTKETVASYLAIQRITKLLPSMENPATFTFEQLYGDIDDPCKMYTELDDTKNTHLKEDFITNVRNLPDWDAQYVRLFPTVLKKNLLDTLVVSGKTDKVERLVQDSFTDYRNNREAVLFFFRESRDEEWFKSVNISFEKQIATLVNIVSLCYREIDNHVNTVANKKICSEAERLLFESKGADGEKKNIVLDYMLENDTNTIERMYTMINDVKNMDAKYKSKLRNGILAKHPDFKFQEAETKQEAPKGLLVTGVMLEKKRAEAEQIEKVELPAIAEEVSEARAKGDLKENAEYSAAKEKQAIRNHQLKQLKEEIARAVIFDPTTISGTIVSFGTTVSLHDNKANSDVTYTILGPWESDPDTGVISYLSPLGDNLLDAKVGENLHFTINEREFDYTVTQITAAKL